MKKLAAILLLMICTKANAWCETKSQVGEVAYNINSSYFGTQSSLELDKLITANANANTQSGYFMLEYRLDNEEIAQIEDPKAKAERQTYNRWLAERRIKRVKDYLLNKSLQWPVLTRLSTADKNVTRSVIISRCEATSEPSAFK